MIMKVYVYGAVSTYAVVLCYTVLCECLYDCVKVVYLNVRVL